MFKTYRFANKCKMHNAYWLSLALLIIILDQWSKYWIAANFIPEQVIPILPFFSLVYTFNVGAAFSFLANASGWQDWFLKGLALLVSVAIIHWLFMVRDAKPWMKFALMLILGGALGNLIDRFLYGHVRDFLYFFWRDVFNWPAFNFADTAITIGAAVYVLQIFKRRKKGVR